MSAPRWRTEGHIKRPRLVQALDRRLPGLSQKAPFQRRWIASLTYAEVEVRPFKLTSAYFGNPSTRPFERKVGRAKNSSATASDLPFGISRSRNGRIPLRRYAFAPAGFLLLTRIVGRVDVVDASRTDELHLDDCRLASRPNIVSVLCRVCEEATSFGHLASLLQFFAVAETDTATDYGNGFRIGMRVWRYCVVRGKADPLNDHPASLRGIACQNGQLAALWNGRIVLPCQRLGRSCGHGILRLCRANECDDGRREG